MGWMLLYLMMVYKIESIDYDLKIVCFNNIKGIGNGLFIPAGPLREKINSINKI